MALVLNGSGITSANIADGTIVNADINSSAAIDGSKLTGAGKVLQVVQNILPTGVTTSSTSYIDSGLSVTITPTSATSKILIMVNGGGHRIDTHDMQWYGTLFTGGSNIANGLGGANDYLTCHYVYGASGGAYDFQWAESMSHLHSPATTSATEYKYRVRVSTGTLKWNINGVTSMTVMEIGV